MNPLIQLKRRTSIILVASGLAFFVLSPAVEAVSPPPDGGYPGGNTAEGQNALLNLTTGTFNAAFGWQSLRTLSIGNFNTGVGAGTLALNTADQNTATGAGALLVNTTGFQNTANGAFALLSNTTAGMNTAIGYSAMEANTTGQFNTATGVAALISNTTGSGNTAAGASALLANTTGVGNAAIGTNALVSSTTGGDNTAMGTHSLFANSTGNFNTAVGYGAGSNATTGSGNVYIGAGMSGVAAESDACYIASIDGQTSASGIAVLINSSGKLGTTTSSKRFKESIKPMDKASEALFALKPVTFRYKKELDPQGLQQWGLVAEDVQRVNPALVALDKEGKPYSVRYDQVNAMLLNEFLKEHSKVEKLEATVAKQHKDFDAALADLKGQIQKVTAQLELSKTAPQTVLNGY